MGEYKSQAKRLRARLKASGVDIPVALSLEGVAAMHGKKNWDELAPLDGASGTSPAKLLETFQYHGVHDAGGPPANGMGAITSIQGVAGAGKTRLACAMARALAEERGYDVLYLDSQSEGISRERVARITAWIGEMSKWAGKLSAEGRRGVDVFDELDGMPEEQVSMLFEAGIQVAAAGHDVILVRQRRGSMPGQGEGLAVPAGMQAMMPAVRWVYLGL